MSSTRRSTDGEFHQERFCSAPEFEGDAINGGHAAKRISIIKERSLREVLWFIQWRSLRPGGLQQLCDEIISVFPDRIGTPTLRKVFARKQKRPSERELKAIRSECRSGGLADIKELLCDSESFRAAEWTEVRPSPEKEVRSCMDEAHEAATSELHQHLKRCCLDPSSDLQRSPWYFDDLLGALKLLRERFIKSAQSRLADTVVSRRINETLEFWFARRRMVLIEGVAGIGRTATTQAWCDAHAGLARYVEVPSSSDDRSFFASIARELGVARGASFKAQQIKVRVEEMLATSDLMLAFDESQYLWTQLMRPRRTPDRLLWIKSILDSGTPVALIAHSDFTKWREHYIEKTLWADEQFERRLNRRVVLPLEHSREDMLKIARAHLPSGEQRSWKLLAGYALGTEKKQASGIVEALESARYRADQAGRSEVIFADIEAALIQDHQFLKAAPAANLQPPRTRPAKALQLDRNRAPMRSTGSTEFPIRGRFSGSRIKTPVGT
jgi:AAA domain-containing protein